MWISFNITSFWISQLLRSVGCIFNQVWEVFSNYFFKIPLAPSPYYLPVRILVVHLLNLVLLFLGSLKYCLFFPGHFWCFRLGEFYYSFLRLTESILCLLYSTSKPIQ